jgi:hypothetical protein
MTCAGAVLGRPRGLGPSGGMQAPLEREWAAWVAVRREPYHHLAEEGINTVEALWKSVARAGKYTGQHEVFGQGHAAVSGWVWAEAGTEPKWEAARNLDGTTLATELPTRWTAEAAMEEMAMAVLGEGLPHPEHVTLFRVMRKFKGPAVELWLAPECTGSETAAIEAQLNAHVLPGARFAFAPRRK